MATSQRKQQGGAILFILATIFLNFAGIGIINPVYPFLVGKYTERQDTALAISLLFTSFSLCQFLTVPMLGALSDRFGRRPILLISLFGSAIGYIIFGIGGALWVLFLGRIIDGITGGNIATIYAYAADISTPEERTRFFGVLGAVSGFGFVFGPALGGLAWRVTGVYESPLYLAAALTLLNTLWGYFAMPESLSVENRSTNVPLAKFNPLTQLTVIFRLPQLQFLLVATFIWALAFALLQSNIAHLTENHFGWQPDGAAVLLTIVGAVTIFTQGFLIRRLLPRFGEARLAMLGLFLLAVGFGIITLAILAEQANILFLSAIFVALGNGMTLPSLTGLLSQGVTVREQGMAQGGGQSMQALGRVFGPLWGGWTYREISHATPYISGALGLLLAILIVVRAVPALKAYQARMAAAPTVASETYRARN